MGNFLVGIDIVDIKNLEKRLNRSKLFIEKILTIDEIAGKKIKSMAGKIAAKEAIIKTGYITHGQWKKIKIMSSPSGKPIVLNGNGEEISTLEISISHTEDTAIAVAIYEKN